MLFIFLNFVALIASAAEPISIVQIQGPDGFCLTTPPAAREQIISKKCGEDPHQRFSLEKLKDNSYRIRSEKNNYCLGPLGLSKSPRAKIIEWDCIGIEVEKWELKDSRIENKKVLFNKASGLCLNFKGLMITQDDCGAFNLVDQAVSLQNMPSVETRPKPAAISPTPRKQR